MNDRALGERITSAYEASAPQREPAGLLDHVLLTTGHTRQRPRWLALIKEPPMRISSRLAVGSPTARMAAILLATLLVAVLGAGAVFTGSALLAASAPLVVAEDGSGTHTTVIDAVADAEDGDTILVKPGTYTGTVVIDKDITLRGDGPREEVVIEFGSDSPGVATPWALSVRYGILFVDSTATVSDLTVRGPNVATAFLVVGGSPTIEHVTSELEGDYSGSPHSSIGLIHGAGATIRDSVLDGPIWDLGNPTLDEYADVQGTSRVVVSGNTLDTGIWVPLTDGASVTDNTLVAGAPSTSLGTITLRSTGTGTAEVSGNSASAVTFGEGSDETGVTVRGNTLRGGDEFGAGITLSAGAPFIEENDIGEASVGISVADGAAPTIRLNRIDVSGDAISVAGDATAPVIEENWLCGGAQALLVPEGSTLTLDPSNEVCSG